MGVGVRLSGRVDLDRFAVVKARADFAVLFEELPRLAPEQSALDHERGTTHPVPDLPRRRDEDDLLPSDSGAVHRDVERAEPERKIGVRPVPAPGAGPQSVIADLQIPHEAGVGEMLEAEVDGKAVRQKNVRRHGGGKPGIPAAGRLSAQFTVIHLAFSSCFSPGG